MKKAGGPDRLWRGVAMAIVALIATPLVLLAQLSGNYTIGGGGTYQNFSEAIAALNAQGVSGPVVFRVRAGVYQSLVAADPVITMDQNITGVSPTNRITFRPDSSTGANRDNVILTRTLPITSSYQTIIARIRCHYVTLEDFTFKNEDITTTGNHLAWMISIAPASGNEIRGVRIEGSRIQCYSGTSRGNTAIALDGQNIDVQVRNNEILGSVYGVQAVFLGRNYSTVVEGNFFRGNATTIAGGSRRGTCVQLLGSDIVIKDNVFDYANGGEGEAAITLGDFTSNVRIEGNLIRNTSPNGGGDFDRFTGISLYGASISGGVIANNMMAGIFNAGVGMSLYASNVKIYHNTVVLPQRNLPAYGGATPLYLNGTGNRVMNNILIDLSTAGINFVAGAMAIYDTTGNHFNHNLLFVPAGQRLLVASGTHYYSLEAWRSTGYDVNSVSKMPDFVALYRDPHLFDCSTADTELHGTPVPEVTHDFDGQIRSTVRPFMGADEGLAELPPIFGLPVQFPAGRESWLFTSHDLDLDGAVDIIVTNTGYNNGSNDVAILWNDGNGNLSAPQRLSFGNNPDVVKAGLINADTMPDLVVTTGDSILVRFGLGGRAFSAPVVIASFPDPHIMDLHLADYDIDGDTDILWLWSPPVPPADSGSIFVGINNGNGTFTLQSQFRAGVLPRQFRVADLNNDGFVDLAVVDGWNFALNTLRNLGVITPGVSLGFGPPQAHDALVSSFPSASLFVVDDFDGDGDKDMILGRYSRADSLVLLRNNGAFSFGREGFSIPSTRYPRVLERIDYDGDGRPDLVSGNHTKDMHLLLNDGTGQFTRTMLCSRTDMSGIPLGILTTHMDSDTSPDVVLIGANDTITVFRNLQWIPVRVEDDRMLSMPERFALHQNYPNPFNPSTIIRYALPEESHVRLAVYNILGQRVITLVEQWQPAGEHHVRWEGVNAAGARVGSGVYFSRLEVHAAGGGPRYTGIRKMLKLQ